MVRAFAVLAAIGTVACGFQARSDEFTCETQTDCDDGRVCMSGWCVVDPDAPEPGLEKALRGLSHQQRAAVLLVEALGLTYQEAADLLDVSRSSIQTHLERGLKRLRTDLGVTTDA